VAGHCQGKAEVSVGKPVAVPIAPRQIPDGLLSDRGSETLNTAPGHKQ
jgi:hypothetical protein